MRNHERGACIAAFSLLHPQKIQKTTQKSAAAHH